MSVAQSAVEEMADLIGGRVARSLVQGIAVEEDRGVREGDTISGVKRQGDSDAFGEISVKEGGGWNGNRENAG